MTMGSLVLALSLCAAAGEATPAGPAGTAERPRLRVVAGDQESWLDDSGEGSPALPQGVRVLRDLRYGEDPRQRLDVYLPEAPRRAPVIFMVHGGAWRVGDKAMSRVVAHKVARWVPRGVLFVSTNYRLLPTDPVSQAEDVGRALAFAQGHAAEWGGDEDAFVLMGHSAGAHLVSLLNSAPERARVLGARPWLGAVSLDTAAMDIAAVMAARHYRFYDAAFGSDPTYWKRASPLHQLAAGAPPLLAVCSSRRPDQPCRDAHAYAEAARRRGLRVEVLEQSRSHAAINGELGQPGAYTEAVERFLASLAPRFAVAPR